MKKNKLFPKYKEILFSEKYRKITKLVIILLFIFLFVQPIISIFIAIGYLGYIDHIIFSKLMKDFARKNNLEYKGKFDPNILSGLIFEIGHSKKVLNAIEGEYKNFPIKLFNYFYTTGSGKNSQRHSFTMTEIHIHGTEFPYIFLKSDSMPLHYITNIFGKNKSVRIKLEKDLEDTFNLYCTEDYEIEVLQIFTKEVLAILKKNADKLSIIFSKDKIYIYDDRIMRTEEDLDKFLSAAHHMIDNTGELMKRLSDDFRSLHEVYRK